MKKYSIATFKGKVIAYLLRFLIAGGIATGIFFLRIRGSTPYEDDYIYCLTGFIILVVPAFLAIFKITYVDKDLLNRKSNETNFNQGEDTHAERRAAAKEAVKKKIRQNPDLLKNWKSKN